LRGIAFPETRSERSSTVPCHGDRDAANVAGIAAASVVASRAGVRIGDGAEFAGRAGEAKRSLDEEAALQPVGARQHRLGGAHRVCLKSRLP
jgi:hypothetical protein